MLHWHVGMIARVPDKQSWRTCRKAFQIHGKKYSKCEVCAYFMVHIVHTVKPLISNISRALVGNKLADHSDVVGASPVGAVPTTSSYSMFTLLLLLQMWVNKKCISFDSFYLLFILAVMLTGFILNEVKPPYNTICYSTASNIAGYGMCMTNTDQTTNSQSTPHTSPLRIIDLCNIDHHDIKRLCFYKRIKKIKERRVHAVAI